MPMIIASCPFDRPDPALVAALAATRALAVLDLGRDPEVAAAALARTRRLVKGPFGIRIARAGLTTPETLPDSITTVILEHGLDVTIWGPRDVLVQVTSVDEARAAVTAGAAGLIAKGYEAGGRIGEETAFVLTQRIAAEGLEVPVWVQGGISLRAAAACLAAGARGVYLDEQLALVRESGLNPQVARAVVSFDGTETAVIHGYRVFSRPDLPIARHGNEYSAEEVAGLLGCASLHDSLIPMGQATAFANDLARRFKTAAGVIRAFESRADEQLRDAVAVRPLAPDSPLARDFGTRYPIAQGPMTRVSDRADFAAAVAAAGGLPFLALSVMRGPDVEQLLSETSRKLGERSWGVGVLGFVPPGLREEQLEIIRRFRPPFALIAGGRPSQSRLLEEAGIATFLHVPSPRLLELFLKEGARRFVFEGSECGGHVGPRTSFTLWESAVERLLAFDRIEETQLLFAGGIHDARSAAMVAAMTAPLAARGAHIGVLMGTAYLLTREATESGAVLPGYQRAAIECRRTVLLETSPGHATRCAESAYVETFRNRRAELAASGVSPDRAWIELEQLNLGRLRIASKGQERQRDRLVSVDEDTQAREGMYMIGQIAALRGETCTIDDLHCNVIDGAIAHLENLPAVSRRERAAPRDAPPRPVDVAIVGMACVFPGSRDLSEFWANILDGRNLITEVPRERWNPDLYYDPAATGKEAGRKTPSKWGGFLPAVDFDPLEWGIPPNSLASIEPVQLLSLHVAARALEDAGVDQVSFDRERVSVVFGAEAGTDLSAGYGFRALFPQYAGELPPELDAVLPTLTEDSFPGVLANVIAGRIANRLDLGGVNFTVDAACASSLAAVDAAVKELVGGGSDFVLCGGADLHNTINDYLLFSSVHALSPTGQCRTFDAAADGIVLGEGIGCIALKRLADAERDGDRIYAVIKGIAGSSDGRSLGLTAPRHEGQKRALDRAYHKSGVSPADIGLVEAHGTGTVVGDRTELATLAEVFGNAGARPGGCALGSVKSQIGHTKCAAGIAGLIKAALAIHHGVQPPTLNVTQPNPSWSAGTSPFLFRQQAHPWLDTRRAAGVSALGFGGTNFHVVLAGHEAAELPLRASDRWPAELLLFRGDSDSAHSLMSLARAWIDGTGTRRLRDLARTLASAGDGPVQVAVVAGTLEEARDRLDAALDGREGNGVYFCDRAVTGGKLAFVFPGQGSQRVGMLAELFVKIPPLRRFLELGGEYVDRIYPPAAYSKDQLAAQAEALTDTRCAQPALGMAGLAVAEFLDHLGIRPDHLAGHSYGELVALCHAGAFSPETLLELSAARGQFILESAGSDPGMMAAVVGGAAEIEAFIRDDPDVVIANHNSPRQTVISGTEPAVERATEKLREAGFSARRIPVACAFHSPLVRGARELLAAKLAECEVFAPKVPVWSNATAAPYPADVDGVRKILAGQVAEPVRFVEQVNSMYDAGVRIFVEAGPGRTLSGLISRTLKGRPHRVVPCDDPPRASLNAVLEAVAQLAVLGVELQPQALFTGRDAEWIDLERPPMRSASTWLVDGQMARPVSGNSPPHGFVPVDRPLVSVGVPARESGAAPADDRQQAILDYLRNVRELISAQREVMARYLGGAVPDPLPAPQPNVATPSRQQPDPTPETNELDRTRSPSGSTGLDIGATLLAIVSERTGYPTEMLDLELDMEAELSIDSIKRIEILGELREQVGLGVAPGKSEDEIVEELASLKTLGGLLGWLRAHRADISPVSAPEPAKAARPEAAGFTPVEAAAASTAPLPRFRPVPADAPSVLVRDDLLSGKSFRVVDDGRGIGRHLVDLISGAGGRAELIAGDDAPGPSDGLIDLTCLAEDASFDWIVPLFRRMKRGAMSGCDVLFAASPCGGGFGLTRDGGRAPLGGVGGLMKSLAREYPEAMVRSVDLEPDAPPERLAAQLLTELQSPDGLAEVGYRGQQRRVVRLEPVEVPARTNNPATDVPLDEGSVVLIAGGARGICAELAKALARRFRCRLELVGRTPVPTEEAEDIATVTDAPALRRALIARGLSKPAEIEAECAGILAARAVRSTMEAIETAGARVTYHACDARNAQAFGELIDQIYDSAGRIDCIVHGAGVLQDKLIRDKSEAGFQAVFDTKVVPAQVIGEKLRPGTRAVLFFASVSGVFGNRGQCDYAAANDALDKLALWLDGRHGACVRSIDWGPWSDAGMVGPELARDYARRGIPMIPLEEGVQLALAALSGATGFGPQTLVMAGDPSAFDGPAESAIHPDESRKQETEPQALHG